MATVLTDAGFADLLANFRESWFKLEAQPAYAIGAEREALERFQEDGTLLPPSEFGWWQDWLAGVRKHVRDGKVIQRVRVLDEPPTPYQRYLLAVDHWHTEAGEQIAYMSRKTAVRVGLRLVRHDWHLFDDTKAAVTWFTAEGKVDRRELVTDPMAVFRMRVMRRIALRLAHPAAEIAAA
jgi:hypothetical protein